MVSHTRHFSALGEWQRACTLIYAAEAAPGGQRLTLTRQTAEGCESQTVLLPIAEREAERALCYLAENAVSMEHWRDVLADLLPQAEPVC